MATLLAMVAPGDGSGSNLRGWAQCALSATACIFGACIVYVDLFIRLLPGKKSFRIQDSRAFLSCSLSLSFGVMIFSSLFSMLPSSKTYLRDGGVSDHAAGFLMMAGFAFGFVGMQVISRIIHRFMPSHVVDCDHSHAHGGGDTPPHARHAHGHAYRSAPPTAAESTPLLPPAAQADGPAPGGPPRTQSGSLRPPRPSLAGSLTRPVSMLAVRQRVLSFVRDTKADCDEFGPCYGFTDPCGQECKRRVVAVAVAAATPSAGHVAGPTDDAAVDCAVTSSTANSYVQGDEADEEEEEVEEEEAASSETVTGYGSTNGSGHGHGHGHGHNHDGVDPCCDGADGADDGDLEAGRGGGGSSAAAHHHHVPANAFLSIGLQTVLAIGLHKFPEGFIAFATNHADPALGLNVFVALFVHNIAEGFAMALPLYMALGSRLRAVLWAAALGGLSQPLGAGAAALWLRHLGGRDGDGGSNGNNGVAYGMLFAGTAGLMAAVALQLFAEGLTLHHNRQLSIGFAFVGMLLLGLSSALGH